MRKERSTKAAVRVWGVAFAVLVLLAGALPEASAALRAGAAAANITEDKPTGPVHDPLMAKALVLEDGSHKVVIISLDLIEATDSIVAGVRRGAEKEIGIDPSGVLINASHNHRTSGQIAKDVVPRIVGAVKQASQNMVPARIGVGVGREERITMNRRLRMKDGKQWTIRRSTPSPADAEEAGLGPFDPQIGLLRVDTLAGKPLALVYNFAGHPYGGVPDGGATADYPGFASRVIESAWPGAVALFVQGAGGDTTPVQFKHLEAPQPTEELGTKLGLSALQAAQGISTTNQALVRAVREVVEFPRRTDAAERIQALLAEQEKILQFYTAAGPGVGGNGLALNFKMFLPLYLKQALDPEHPSEASFTYQQEELTGQSGLRRLDAENKKRIEIYRQCIDKMDRLITIRTNLRLLQEHLDRRGSGPLVAEIQAIRIGDFVLVTFPGELFVEVGLRIKERSPFPKTFIAGYTNGGLGYAPTADSYDKQAYEDSCTYLAPQWQELYERKALELIRRLGQSGD